MKYITFSEVRSEKELQSESIGQNGCARGSKKKRGREYERVNERNK